jgi:hypothetical protein
MRSLHPYVQYFACIDRHSEPTPTPFGLRHTGAGTTFTQELALVQEPQAQSLANLIAYLSVCPKLCLLIANHLGCLRHNAYNLYGKYNNLY